MDILLVVGHVTFDLYYPVMKKMAEQGMQPEIVRINTSDKTVASIMEGLMRASRMTDDQRTLFSDSNIGRRMQTIVDDAFGEWIPEMVRAVIRYEPEDTYEGRLHMLWLDDFLPEECDDFIVRVGNNGEPWVQSARYGTIESNLPW